MRCQTRVCSYATRRPERAAPELHPISCDSMFHGIPERSTNTIPKDEHPLWGGIRTRAAFAYFLIKHGCRIAFFSVHQETPRPFGRTEFSLICEFGACSRQSAPRKSEKRVRH